jgi:hypothetical protein
MSNKLLIYIGDKKKFDLATTIQAISSIRGVSNPKTGSLIGAIFECNYSADGRQTTVRISPDAETVTVEGLGNDALDFALEFQKITPVSLHAIDMNYSFNVALSDFKTVSEFKSAIKS